jgi:hypothetical protein
VGAGEVIYWHRERRPQLLSGQTRPTGTGQKVSRTPSDYEREGEQLKDLTACKYCKEKGYLVMNIGLVDEVCEACGKWQGGIYSDTYERVG